MAIYRKGDDQFELRQAANYAKSIRGAEPQNYPNKGKPSLEQTSEALGFLHDSEAAPNARMLHSLHEVSGIEYPVSGDHMARGVRYSKKG